MRVELSRRASRDLEEIADYIAIDNPRRAASFVNELTAKAEAIGLQPYTWPLLRLRVTNGIRQRIHGNYLILYRVETKRVLILHILHAARNIQAILTVEDEE